MWPEDCRDTRMGEDIRVSLPHMRTIHGQMRLASGALVITHLARAGIVVINKSRSAAGPGADQASRPPVGTAQAPELVTGCFVGVDAIADSEPAQDIVEQILGGEIKGETFALPLV